jgi:protein-L-isoaspartate(D-aspartate) O-methyltransferase
MQYEIELDNCPDFDIKNLELIGRKLARVEKSLKMDTEQRMKMIRYFLSPEYLGRTFTNNEEMVDFLQEVHEDTIDEKVYEALRKADLKKFISIPKEMGPTPDEIFQILAPYKYHYYSTITSPQVVSIITHYLDLELGQNVLEVGTGSGYNACIVSYLIRPDGKLVSVEIEPGLEKLAKENIEKVEKSLGFKLNIDVRICDGSIGYPPDAPYDRIYVTAGLQKDYEMEILLEQLNDGGIIVTPQKTTLEEAENIWPFYADDEPPPDNLMILFRYEKNGKSVVKRAITRCGFLPLRGKYGLTEEEWQHFVEKHREFLVYAEMERDQKLI